MILAPIKKPRKKLCRCHACLRERKLERLAARLSARDAKWLLGFGEYVVLLEQQASALKDYVSN